MDRLEAVSRIRQRPRHDDAHGVIEVGHLHFIFNIDCFYGSYVHMVLQLAKVGIIMIASLTPPRTDCCFASRGDRFGGGVPGGGW